MAATEVNARWQAEMAEFFEDLEGRAPDEGFLRPRGDLPPRGPAAAADVHRTDEHEEEVTTMTSFGEIAARLEGQAIEVPSWAYGNSGTRFKVFGTPGHAAHGRGEDRRRGRRCTGSPASRRRSRCTSRGTRSTTTRALRRYAEDLGRRGSGTINSNTFQDDDYKLGSLTHADPRDPAARRSTTTSTASTSWTRPARAT